VTQLLGDCDWETWDAGKGCIVPTTSMTVAHGDVLGAGLGASFEYNGNLIFLFGDTFGANGEAKPEGTASEPLPAHRSSVLPYLDEYLQ